MDVFLRGSTARTHRFALGEESSVRLLYIPGDPHGAVSMFKRANLPARVGEGTPVVKAVRTAFCTRRATQDRAHNRCAVGRL